MRNAIIHDGIVVNIIEGAVPDATLIPDDGTAQIGGSWDGTQFHPASVPVPASVSPRQIRQAMTRAGLRSAVEAAISAGDQDIKDWYEWATDFERANPKVAELAAALGVTESQLDDLWRLAATL